MQGEFATAFAAGSFAEGEEGVGDGGGEVAGDYPEGHVAVHVGIAILVVLGTCGVLLKRARCGVSDPRTWEAVRRGQLGVAAVLDVLPRDVVNAG